MTGLSVEDRASKRRAIAARGGELDARDPGPVRHPLKVSSVHRSEFDA
jgi:hypothetical protein